MARVDITLNDRVFPIACEDGQEGRLMEIAGYVDDKLREIKTGIGTASDMHLLVMAGLMVADELLDAREELAGERQSREGALAQAKSQAQRALAAAEEAKARADRAQSEASQQVEGLKAALAEAGDDPAVAAAIGRLADRVEALALALERT